MRTTPQVSGLSPVTVYIARFKCRAEPGSTRTELPLPAGLGPPESSTGPSTLNTFTLPTFLPGRARPESSPLDLWQCKRGYRNKLLQRKQMYCSIIVIIYNKHFTRPVNLAVSVIESRWSKNNSIFF